MRRPVSLSRGLSRLRRLFSRIPTGSPETLLAGLVFLVIAFGAGDYTTRPVELLVELAVCATCAAYGRWPRQATVVLVVLLALLATPLASHRFSILTVLVPITSAGARGRRAERWTLTAMFCLVAGIQEVPGSAGPDETSLPELLARLMFWLILLALAWIAGEALKAVERDRSRLESERTAAVHAQRRSIARDLHDTIAYSTTSIILRAEQAKLRGVSDPHLAADLDYIIAAGRSSMRDLRGMMETLRRNDPDAQVAQQSPWRVSSLDEVLATREAELTARGFAVTRHVDADLDGLSESIRETLAKVVVEATGNMIKHGDPSGGCSIMIEATEQEVEAVFINKPATGHVGPETSRLGLIGARERVEALGGEIEVASETPRWVVQVRIPLGM